jgi:tetratricopeptide (TPR) repeat protein
MMVTPMFAGIESMRADALNDSTGLGLGFGEALEQVVRFGLLEKEVEARYVIHPKTRTFAGEKALSEAKFAAEARKRCAEHYLTYVKTSVVRDKPEPKYWNALVTERMKEIDPEWMMIRDVMSWCEQQGWDDLLIGFVMVLVHYMDSRFLNQERLLYVGKAIEALGRRPRAADEALLRVDALGWTYVEESNWSEAHQQIDEGLRVAARVEATNERMDLIALGKAWKARALIEQFKASPEADRLIEEALEDAVRRSPWIRVRIQYVAGDIALKEGRNEDALKCFLSAESALKEYGGEGGGYQIKPRVGMALVSLGHISEAEHEFEALRQLPGIPVGNLYGRYGLALASYQRGEHSKAEALVQESRQQLEKTARSNLLWTLFDDLFSKLKNQASPNDSAK